MRLPVRDDAGRRRLARGYHPPPDGGRLPEAPGGARPGHGHPVHGTGRPAEMLDGRVPGTSWWKDLLVTAPEADPGGWEQRIAAVRRLEPELAGEALPVLCDQVIERLRPEGLQDDVALVAIRLHREDRPRPRSAAR